MSDSNAGYTVVHIAVGPDGQGSVCARSWEIPAGDEAVERFAAMLTEAYGEPTEWVTGDIPDFPVTVYEP